MTSGLAALPEQTLAQLLGGFLLTYFRSAHPSERRLQLLREFPSVAAGFSVRTDFVIYDDEAHAPVAVFELARDTMALKQKQGTLLKLSKFLKAKGKRVVVGLVSPESIASASLRDWIKTHQFELVTYPD